MSDSIAEKLSRIQSELVAPKNQFNKFGNYNYRSCEDIVEAAKPLLLKEGLALLLSDTMVEVGGRVYVKAHARVADKTDVCVEVTAFAREPESQKGMAEPQVTGSASSYARKYALNGLFAIDDTKDADSTNKHGKDEPAKKQAAPKQPERNWIKEIQTTTTVEELQGVFKEASKSTNGEELGKIIMAKDKRKQALKEKPGPNSQSMRN